MGLLSLLFYQFLVDLLWRFNPVRGLLRGVGLRIVRLTVGRRWIWLLPGLLLLVRRSVSQVAIGSEPAGPTTRHDLATFLTRCGRKTLFVSILVA